MNPGNGYGQETDVREVEKMDEYMGKERKVLLDIRNLSVEFEQYAGGIREGENGFRKRKLQTIQNLNVTVHAGELVAVVGESGSGKSLLAHGILGILPYNARMGGEIYYDGELLTEARKKKLRGTEMVLVPQSVAYLDPLMKIGMQICGGRRGRAVKERMTQIRQDSGLPEYVENAYPFELSGGMNRRVLLATAAMQQPRLVIADEPTPGLHMEMAEKVMRQFRAMADAGAGVLVITHDLEQALSVADRIAVFYEGTTIETVTAAEFFVKGALRHPYAKALQQALLEREAEPGQAEEVWQSETIRKPEKSEQAKEMMQSAEERKQAMAARTTRPLPCESVLQAKQISFRYGENSRQILQDFNLSIKSGERVGMMAPSGYGKTTLCRVLAGYEKPDTGEVLLDGKSLDTYGTYCPVQLISQHPEQAVNPRLRMSAILAECDGDTDRLMQELGIHREWLNRYPAELSGGELQRFCIARALGERTRFLLADETTAMLDLVTQNQIWNFLCREVSQRGIGLLVVSHDLKLLQRICTKIYDLEQMKP